MAKDFREYLVEASRHDVFGRVFKEVAVGRVMISFQASETHSCYPAETLDDLRAYTRWEVSLRAVKPAIDVARAGAWSYLMHNSWAKPFEKPDFQRTMQGDNIPTRDCQRILEDVLDFSIAKGHIGSEDDIRILEPEEEVKKNKALGGTGCGGCGGRKTLEKM